MRGVNQFTCYQSRYCHSLECCFACISHLFIVLYYGCAMMNVSRYTNCYRKLKDEMIMFHFVPDPAGWWRGRLRGKEGLFPANYIEKI